ncbi:MAG: hypothetical protein MPJ78_12635 [Hyphomicrobiaceae bacterium]|nr:hypothetical protein [Hyphomicrobiaceae bacterium]
MIASQPSPVSTDTVYPASAPVTVRGLSLAIVWLTICSSSIVYTDPAPYDALMLGLIVLLPMVGLAAFSPGVNWFLVAWLLVAAGGLVASMRSSVLDVATTHTLVSLYLSMSAVLIAAFVSKDPARHGRLIMSALCFAAMIAALAGMLGYFDILPGARGLFTKFDRARGLFKDPNVYGPFLVPPLLYFLHGMITARAARAMLHGFLGGIVALGLLLSFSRGAWINAGMSLLVYGYILFVTVSTNRLRIKLLAIAVFAACAAVLGLLAALQVESIAALIGERASFSQSYDLGPDGRFAGQVKAFGIIAANPLGIGALEFGRTFDNEDVHNVYLSMFLNAGWLGGFTYLGLVLATLAAGFRMSLRRGPLQGVSIVLFAAFAGLAAEGMVVDTDHWRLFYILMGLVWGVVLGEVRQVFVQSFYRSGAPYAAPYRL